MFFFTFFETRNFLRTRFFNLSQPKSWIFSKQNLKMRRTRISPGQLYTFVKTCEKSNDYVKARQIANYWLCVLCGVKHRGSGHNPMPFSDGERYRCCEKCYEEWVECYYDEENDHLLTREKHCEILDSHMVLRECVRRGW